VPRRYGARRALQRGGQRCAHPVRSPTGIPGGRRGLVRPELGAYGLGGGAGQGGKGVRGSSSLSNVYSGEDNLDVLIA